MPERRPLHEARFERNPFFPGPDSQYRRGWVVRESGTVREETDGELRKRMRANDRRTPNPGKDIAPELYAADSHYAWMLAEPVHVVYVNDSSSDRVEPGAVNLTLALLRFLGKLFAR